MNPNQLKQKIANRCCVIISNYGDDSLALIQWALESELLKSHRSTKQLKVVYIETGFADCSWAKRVAKGIAYVEQAGLEAIHLISQISFQEAVLGRGAFPNYKFQWCSTVLKGLPLLDWLDTIDSSCQAILLSAKRSETLLPPYQNLPEWLQKSEHFNDRALWHPILNIDLKARDGLLKRANFQPMGHRSLECNPCVNSSLKSLALLSETDIQKVKILEESLGTPLFPKDSCDAMVSVGEKPMLNKVSSEGIESFVKHAKLNAAQEKNRNCVVSHELSLFYRGCGNPFSCGI